MAQNTIKVFLMVHPKGNEKPEKIELPQWTNEQKTDFLKAVKSYTPIDGLVTDRCAFNVHYGSLIVHALSFKTPTEFTPTRPQNKPDEMIIEIIPDRENPLCNTSTPQGCMNCLQKNECPSTFIKNVIPTSLLSKEK